MTKCLCNTITSLIGRKRAGDQRWGHQYTSERVAAPSDKLNYQVFAFDWQVAFLLIAWKTFCKCINMNSAIFFLYFSFFICLQAAVSPAALHLFRFRRGGESVARARVWNKKLSMINLSELVSNIQTFPIWISTWEKALSRALRVSLRLQMHKSINSDIWNEQSHATSNNDKCGVKFIQFLLNLCETDMSCFAGCVDACVWVLVKRVECTIQKLRPVACKSFGSNCSEMCKQIERGRQKAKEGMCFRYTHTQTQRHRKFTPINACLIIPPHVDNEEKIMVCFVASLQRQLRFIKPLVIGKIPNFWCQSIWFGVSQFVTSSHP